MIWEIHRELHKRGMTQTKLALLAGVGRCSLSQVMANKPGRGKYTRRRLLPHLTHREVILLGWEEDWMKWWAERARLATFHVEQCSK